MGRHADPEYHQKYYQKNKKLMVARATQWGKDNPKQKAYTAQKIRAAQREVEWDITYEEWTEWWGIDFEKRGRKPDDLCMSRFNDEGPYRLGNIFKNTVRENVIEMNHLRVE